MKLVPITCPRLVLPNECLLKKNLDSTTNHFFIYTNSNAKVATLKSVTASLSANTGLAIYRKNKNGAEHRFYYDLVCKSHHLLDLPGPSSEKTNALLLGFIHLQL